MIEQQTPNPGVAKGNRDKKPMIQVKQGQLNFTALIESIQLTGEVKGVGSEFS
jgi:hypothetical protein